MTLVIKETKKKERKLSIKKSHRLGKIIEKNKMQSKKRTKFETTESVTLRRRDLKQACEVKMPADY